METQRSSIFSKNWRKFLKFEKIISVLGFMAILSGLFFGNSIVRWTTITPHFHSRITSLNNTNGFNYSQQISFKNDGDAYGYLISVSTVISDNDGKELGTFTADSCFIENKAMDISEIQLTEGKTTTGRFKFSQKSPNKIIFHSGISYKSTTTCMYYRKFSGIRTIAATHKSFTVAFSDTLILMMNNNCLKERTQDLSTFLTE